jgi:hypothetical protein
MSIYSDEVQQLTDQLVSDVNNLNTVVTNETSDSPPNPDWTAITTATDAVSTTANSFDQAIKNTDIPPDDTMVLDLSTQLQAELPYLTAAITANDSAVTVTSTNKIVETTSNINRCVTRMAENAVPMPTAEDALPLPPWFAIPTTPPSGG